MTPADLIAARKALGMKAIDLGRALELKGDDPGRTVRLWEKGRPIPGPVRVAVRLMLANVARQGLQDALQEARAILTPENPPAPVLEALDALDSVVFDNSPGNLRPLHERAHTRRRG